MHVYFGPLYHPKPMARIPNREIGRHIFLSRPYDSLWGHSSHTRATQTLYVPYRMVRKLQRGQRGEQILRQSGTLVDDVPQHRGHRCGFSDVMEPTPKARPCCTMVMMRQNATVTVLDSARIFLHFLIGACLSRTYQRLCRYLFQILFREQGSWLDWRRTRENT